MFRSRKVKIVLTREEIEKLFLSCIGELTLLIDVSGKSGSLVERLTSLNNNLEVLYEQTVLRERRRENAH